MKLRENIWRLLFHIMGCNVYFDTEIDIALFTAAAAILLSIAYTKTGDTDAAITSSTLRVRFPLFGCIMLYNRIFVFPKQEVQEKLLLFLGY